MYCVNVFIIRIHFIVSLCPLIDLFSHSYVLNLNFNGSFRFLHSRQFYLGLVRKKAKSKLLACCSYNFGLYFFLPLFNFLDIQKYVRREKPMAAYWEQLILHWPAYCCTRQSYMCGSASSQPLAIKKENESSLWDFNMIQSIEMLCLGLSCLKISSIQLGIDLTRQVGDRTQSQTSSSKWVVVYSLFA